MCDALEAMMVKNQLTISDTTITTMAYAEGLQCISKYKSNCAECKETPYSPQCLYCLQYQCSVTPGTFCCPYLKEAMACDDHLCRHQNTVKTSSLLIPVWAIILLVIGSLFLIMVGIAIYYKSQIKSKLDSNLF
jgi:hypothetical protein